MKGRLTRTVCGTRDYLAPEVIASARGYGFSCDWWSFGCLIYELLIGQPIFSEERAKGDERLHIQSILTKDVPLEGLGLSWEAIDLLSRLFVRDPSQRLTNPSKMKQHAFFKDIDWSKLERREVTPPFTPQSYSVAADKTYLEHLNDQLPECLGEAKDVCHFKGFSFVCDEYSAQ